VAFEDLAMEAIHEFEIRDMPVTVAVDSTGESVHETGPRIWRDWRGTKDKGDSTAERDQ
jgi:fumarate hydratase class I